MAVKNDDYSYRVTWSEEDREYIGLCAEFPSLSWLDASPEAALAGIRNVVAEDMAAKNEVVPQPIAMARYSDPRCTAGWRWRRRKVGLA